jgi:hypothetical protein
VERRREEEEEEEERQRNKGERRGKVGPEDGGFCLDFLFCNRSYLPLSFSAV